MVQKKPTNTLVLHQDLSIIIQSVTNGYDYSFFIRFKSLIWELNFYYDNISAYILKNRNCTYER